jgi:protein O-GlcNAc transferase
LNPDPAQSAQLYRQALAIRPDWAEGWFYLGVDLYGLKRLPESEEALRTARRLAPENGNVWGFLGLAEANAGDGPAALKDIRKGEALGWPTTGGSSQLCVIAPQLYC